MLPRAVRRLPGCSYEGARLYFLTFLPHQRVKRFEDADVVAVVASQIQRAAQQTRFSIVAACYMPDHLHLVVEGLTNAANLHRFAKLAKQLSGFHVKRRFGFQLWARGFHDRIVPEDEDPRRYVRYVRDNPVRARLVKSPADYPYLYIAPSWRDL